MGGEVNIIIRKKNGEVKSCIKATYEMSSFFTHHLFYQQDETFINDFLSNHSYPQTNQDLMAPFYYGLVFVDFQSGEVISSQNYSRLSNISLDRSLMHYYKNETLDVIDLKINQTIIGSGYRSDRSLLLINLKFFFDNNLFNVRDPLITLPNSKENSFSEFIQYVSCIGDLYSLPILHNFFNFNSFESQSVKEQIKLKKKLELNGLIYKQKDHLAWDEHLSELLS